MNGGLNLKAMFYTAYDASLIASFLSKISRMSEGERRSQPGFLGEGVHFQSFEIAANPLPLAVNVAKSAFSQRGDAAIRRWQEAINVARSLDGASLVPPMDVIHASGLTAIVMPKGKDVPRSGAKSVDVMLQDTAKALGQAGLVLDDYPQVREAMGVPFIFDWSDLAFVKTSGRI